MNAPEVIWLYKTLHQSGIAIWIDGGWGVDALLERQSRPHKDLDIVIQQEDVEKFRGLLTRQGYNEIKLEIARPHNFVLGDTHGHEIDVHVIVIDDQGNGIYGPLENGEMYPAPALTGRGRIRNQEMCCVSPEWTVKFHSGYELKEKDFQDVSAVCEKFGIPLPEEYKRISGHQ